MHLDGIHRAVGSNPLANFPSVDIRKHHIQDDQVGSKLLDLHPGVKAVVCGSYFEATVSLETVSHQIHEVLIVVDDQEFLSAALQSIGRDPVVLHEDKQVVSRNPSKATPRYSESFQGSVVKATDNRLLAHLANLGSLARREDCFCIGHGTQPSLLNTQPKSAWQVYSVTLAKTAGLTELALVWPENS
jgi:hypothetical protein